MRAQAHEKRNVHLIERDDDVSPFAESLRLLRISRGLRQAELAELLHCDRSKISALENDLRGAASSELIQALRYALALSDSEMSDLLEAARTSRRSYVIPPESPAKAYRLVRQIFDRLNRMPEVQIDALLAVMRSYSAATLPQPTLTRHRVWRKDKLRKENTMP